jgi:Tfp pilus assembly protein PilZ
MLEDSPEARLRCSSISLEDGADEAWLNGEPMEFCEGGMSFPSRWYFEPGTTLALTLEICGTGTRKKTEGVVAWCEETGERLWTVTVLFLDPLSGLEPMLELREPSLPIPAQTQPPRLP